MSIPSGKVIRIQEFLELPEEANLDVEQLKVLNWFIYSALESEVNLEDTKEVLAFCNYLVICLSKTCEYLKYLDLNDMQVTDVLDR